MWLSCLTSSCFFCALSSACSSPLSSASAPSSWWLSHSTVIPSILSSALALLSQACPFTSSSSECQNTNDLFASAGLWVSLGSSGQLSYGTAWGCFFLLFSSAALTLPSRLCHSPYLLLRFSCDCALGPSPLSAAWTQSSCHALLSSDSDLSLQPLSRGTSRSSVCQLLQRWIWKMEESSPSNRIPSLNNHKKFRDVESRGFYLLQAGGKEVEEESSLIWRHLSRNLLGSFSNL